MFKAYCLLCCFALTLQRTTQLFAAQGFDLATADWSVTSPKNLALNPPTDDMGSAVLELVKKVDPETTEYYSDLCPFNAFKFADLHHSGTFSLVVGLSDGRFCGENVVIDKIASGFKNYDLSTPSSSRFSGPQIEELSGKGELVVIEFKSFTDFNGMNTAPCIANFPVIYSWTGDGYSDVSNQNKQYYERQLASLKAQIAAAEAPPTTGSTAPSSQAAAVRLPEWSQRSSQNSRGASQPYVIAKAISGSGSPAPAPFTTAALANQCTMAEAAKIERFLGIDKIAGYEDAQKWADSNNPDERLLAVAVLKDIGTASAIDDLRILSEDRNGLVAMHAKSALRSFGQPTASKTIDSEDPAVPHRSLN